MKFRKKPVVVEAVQFSLSTSTKVWGHCVKWDGTDRRWFVVTIHGQQTFVEDGDWIITEPDGIHHYPCKPDIFEKTYEPYQEATT